MFSTVTSAFFSNSLTISSPRGDFRLRVTDFLLALNWWKYQGSSSGLPGRSLRPGSPVFGFSILTTSAPSQARASVQDGPASNCVKSTTRTPSRQSSSTPIPSISCHSSRKSGRHYSAGCHKGETVVTRFRSGRQLNYWSNRRAVSGQLARWCEGVVNPEHRLDHCHRKCPWLIGRYSPLRTLQKIIAMKASLCYSEAVPSALFFSPVSTLIVNFRPLRGKIRSPVRPIQKTAPSV